MNFLLHSYSILFILSILSIVAALNATKTYCLPSSPCFPSPQDLQKFNTSVGGRLIKTVPYGAVCYEGSYDEEACRELLLRKAEAGFRLRLPGALMSANWEMDGEEGCPVPVPLNESVGAVGPVKGKCELGGMSSYIVNASCPLDVAKTVNFAAKWKLRFRVKNTGHDATGRSAGKGTFAVWTHYMNRMVWHDTFTLPGPRKSCGKTKFSRVIEAGPGVLTQALNEFAWKHGAVVVGAFCPSVGITGGWLLGGGLGWFSPVYGMGVDNVLMFEVVTADGRIRRVNKCQEEDLFWALRGGGGAFGVMTRVWYQAHPEPQGVGYFVGQVDCKGNGTAFAEAVGRMVDLQVPLRGQGHTVRLPPLPCS
ncbi:FAD-binding domain-containing protein [Bimuria novae-zelandiae CBS 107.79]|uniref:FAD-binding domain-containing protein n=1 Tax=Bimuria novae-zelandiae CBS 107.79 TaxID=1447943 RepID=A0A6A5VJN7_9PLEO|nr:FAD-binding domain-containing protein [Bimuria novae-zelandiae CBS 107.79]